MGHENKEIRVVMCCSDLDSVKGGMVSVVKSLLSYPEWGRFKICYIPTYVEGNRIIKSLYFLRAYIRVLGKMLCRKVDILHLHVSERGSFYRKAFLTQLAKKFGCIVIMHHHGADFQVFYDGLSEKQRQYVRKIFTMADVNLLLSDSLVESFREKAPEAKFIIQHNAVEVPENNPYNEDKRYLITLGRLGERKGTYDFLEALHELDSELPEEIRLCLCGDGETEEAGKLIAEYGLEHRVEFLGWVSGGEKQQIVKNAMCHVLPSYREVLPMSILETMAQGIPNISTTVAAIPEVISNGVEGILIEPGNIGQLKDAIRMICSSENTRMDMSRRAFEKIKKEYSVNACCENIKRIYTWTIKKKQKLQEEKR